MYSDSGIPAYTIPYYSSRTEMVLKSLTGTFGQSVMAPFMDYTAEQATPDNTEPWFPGCPFFDGINKDPERGCSFIRGQKDRKFFVLKEISSHVLVYDIHGKVIRSSNRLSFVSSLPTHYKHTQF